MTQRGKRQNTRQLAFVWGEEGEALGDSGKGFTPALASGREGALAGGLMEAIVAADNLRLAVGRVRANKGSPGVDGMSVEQLPVYLAKEWPHLAGELLAGRYKPRPVRRATIPKRSGGMRELGIPTVVDRLIQQAILQVLTPVWDPRFSPYSYGFRPGKSAHQAVEKARQYVAEGKEWVVDLDLEKFFDRVNHDMLMGELAKRVTDKRLLRLIRWYLEAGVLSEGVVHEREEGTPQGGPLYPLLANILLDRFDRELGRRRHSFCRYADDCNIYVSSQRAGERVMVSVVRYLEKKLKLKVNRKKSGVDLAARRKFLGLRVTGRGEKARLSIAPESRTRLKQEVRRITKRNRGVAMPQVLVELGRYTNGWVGYFQVAKTPSVFQEFDQWLRRRLRCYQWKQWKWPRRRAEALLEAKVGRYLAWGTAYGSHGPWCVAGSPAMSQALSNATLERLGFQSLLKRYQALATS
jgi:RNA-directed DNA polymerase